jgi:hypothetical protein
MMNYRDCSHLWKTEVHVAILSCSRVNCENQTRTAFPLHFFFTFLHSRIPARAVNVLWDKELPCILILSQLGLAATPGITNS